MIELAKEISNLFIEKGVKFHLGSLGNTYLFTIDKRIKESQEEDVDLSIDILLSGSRVSYHCCILDDIPEELSARMNSLTAELNKCLSFFKFIPIKKLTVESDLYSSNATGVLVYDHLQMFLTCLALLEPLIRIYLSTDPMEEVPSPSEFLDARQMELEERVLEQIDADPDILDEDMSFDL